MDEIKQNICVKTTTTEESEVGETLASTECEKPFRRFPGESGEELPNVESDFCRAKAYLMRQCLSSGDNLWDHLNEVLEKILEERPRDIGCTFEEFSYKIREKRFRPKTDYLLDVYFPPRHYPYSQKLISLLQVGVEENVPEKSEAEEEEVEAEPNILESFHFFEQGGIGLPKEDVFAIGVHMRKLTVDFPVEKYRFWGKILGTRANYYVAETELRDDEIIRLNREAKEEEERLRVEQEQQDAEQEEERRLKYEAAVEEAHEKEMKFAEERSKAKYEAMVREAKERGLSQMPEPENPVPWPIIAPLREFTKPKYIESPPEKYGVGTNKKTYFVCRHPGDEWIQLPNVVPKHIIIARSIKRAFTGDLESDVLTYPSFPGKEKHLLRAQIARISACTHISPLGYYTFSEEEEEEEEAEVGAEGWSFENDAKKICRTNFVVNPDYEPVSIRDLVDPSMAFWVHHSPYILKQGRSYVAANVRDDEEEGENEASEPEKEVGPSLLTPLSEDSTMDTVVPWSVRKTSAIYPEHAVAIVRSNLWPGAYAFAAGKKFDYIYIGTGLKYCAGSHSPAPLQGIQEEYPTGPEILEIADPTPEQEEEWRLAHEVKPETEESEEDEEEDAADEVDEDDE